MNFFKRMWTWPQRTKRAEHLIKTMNTMKTMLDAGRPQDSVVLNMQGTIDSSQKYVLTLETAEGFRALLGALNDLEVQRAKNEGADRTIKGLQGAIQVLERKLEDADRKIDDLYAALGDDL
jgi:hypothetical protein